MRVKISWRWAGRSIAFGMIAAAATRTVAVAPHPASCEKIVMTGEVNAAQEWKTAIGEGWVFRVMPIEPDNAGYSGWDLVIDREQPAGFPDALLLATPPYDSINEREIGTTFGVRAQDAIGWNPRSFRFLTSPAFFTESQQNLQRMYRNARSTATEQAVTSKAAKDKATTKKSKSGTGGAAESVDRWLEEVLRRSSPGQFHILDARLTPGVADAPPFGENWAFHSASTTHTIEAAPGGKSTPLGTLNWMKFSVTLWLPSGWKAPATLHATSGACSE
jgi:hypothetical protein